MKKVIGIFSGKRRREKLLNATKAAAGVETIKQQGAVINSFMERLRAKKEYRRETFDQAVDRLGVDEEQLARVQLALQRQAWFFGACMSISFLMMGLVDSMITAVNCLSAGLVFLALWFRAAFRVGQIEQRCLFSVREFLGLKERRA